MNQTFPVLLDHVCKLLSNGAAHVSENLLELESKLAAIYNFHACQSAMVFGAVGIVGYGCGLIFVDVTAALARQAWIEANGSWERRNGR